MENQELEVKFFVSDLGAIENKAKSLGASLLQPRTFEINLRFDTPDGTLGRSFRVLRLRKDTAARLTYKGPSTNYGGARLREEIEFTVSDFEKARVFLEALGYQVSMIYEKFRAVYDLARVHVTFDELPYGNFVELEGPDPESLRRVNDRLGLDWQAQVPASYSVLFDSLKSEYNLPFRDLTFENFKECQITREMLRVKSADAMQ